MFKRKREESGEELEKEKDKEDRSLFQSTKKLQKGEGEREVREKGEI